MGTRMELHEILTGILGSQNVYFQPPETVRMNYPAIVYSRDSVNAQFADDNPWRMTKRYQITVIDRNPDSQIPDKVAQMPMTSFSRYYAADNLHHDTYTTYF